jgi:hypothetical protein
MYITVILFHLLVLIRGSDGGEYEDGRLPGCSAMQTGVSLPTIVALMTEAVQTSETFLNSCHSTTQQTAIFGRA